MIYVKKAPVIFKWYELAFFIYESWVTKYSIFILCFNKLAARIKLSYI
jgi:hypothetical protein